MVFSAYVYIATLSATGVRLMVRNDAASAKLFGGPQLTSTEAWTYLSITGTPDGTATWTFGVEQNGAGAADYYFTGVTIESPATTTFRPFIDGSRPHSNWTGTADASTSVRRRNRVIGAGMGVTG